MKQIIRIAILVGLLVLFATYAMADVLNIVTLGLSPYGYYDKKNATGLSYEVGNKLAEAAGYTPNNVIAPLARAVSDIASGDADIVIMLPSPEVNKVAYNLGSVLYIENVIIGRAETPMRSLREVRGKVLATVRGAKYDDRISKANGIATYPTENYAQSLKMLMAKRVDGVVGPQLGIYHAANKLRVPRRAFGKPLVLSTSPARLFLSNMTVTPERVRRLRQALDLLLENGTIKSLLEKYSL